MKLIFCFTLLHLWVFSCGQTLIKTIYDIDSLVKARSAAAIGRTFPTFTAQNDEAKINNDSLLGKVVLINFWFEGCHPCLAEFEGLNELAEKLKGNKGFEFISFTWDIPETVKRVKEKYKLKFPVFPVSEEECRILNQNNGFPTTIILDRKGVIKYLTCGGSLDSIKAKEFVMTTILAQIQKEL